MAEEGHPSHGPGKVEAPARPPAHQSLCSPAAAGLAPSVCRSHCRARQSPGPWGPGQGGCRDIEAASLLWQSRRGPRRPSGGRGLASRSTAHGKPRRRPPAQRPKREAYCVQHHSASGPEQTPASGGGAGRGGGTEGGRDSGREGWREVGPAQHGTGGAGVVGGRADRPEGVAHGLRTAAVTTSRRRVLKEGRLGQWNLPEAFRAALASSQ